MKPKESTLIEIKSETKTDAKKNETVISSGEILEEKNINGVPVLKINSDFSLMNIGKIQTAINNYLSDKKVKNIVVDLTALDFIDSTAIGVLVKSTLLMRQYQGIMALVPNEKMNTIFRMTNLLSIVKIFNSVDEAVQFIQSK